MQFAELYLSVGQRRSLASATYTYTSVERAESERERVVFEEEKPWGGQTWRAEGDKDVRHMQRWKPARGGAAERVAVPN